AGQFAGATFATLLQVLQPFDAPDPVQSVVQHDVRGPAYHVAMNGLTTSFVSRRRFLTQSAGAAAAIAAASLVPAHLRAWELYQDDLWSTASDILRRIKDPVFPARDVLLTAHGAKGDGTFDCGPAFKAAIEACHAAG